MGSLKANNQNQYSITRDVRDVSLFTNPGNYITHNSTLPLSDATRGNIADYMQLHQVIFRL